MLLYVAPVASVTQLSPRFETVQPFEEMRSSKVSMKLAAAVRELRLRRSLKYTMLFLSLFCHVCTWFA
jgi:hypothetical protein